MHKSIGVNPKMADSASTAMRSKSAAMSAQNSYAANQRHNRDNGDF